MVFAKTRNDTQCHFARSTPIPRFLPNLFFIAKCTPSWRIIAFRLLLLRYNKQFQLGHTVMHESISIYLYFLFVCFISSWPLKVLNKLKFTNIFSFLLKLQFYHDAKYCHFRMTDTDVKHSWLVKTLTCTAWVFQCRGFPTVAKNGLTIDFD